MPKQTRRAALTLAATLLVAALGGRARAEIVGFNNLVGWTYTQPDAGSPADLPNSETVHLTTGNGQRRSIFYNIRQDVTKFSASFTYRAANMNASLVGQGVALVLQNSPSGASAVGLGNGGLGYSGVSNSVATVLFGDTGPGQSYNGYFTGGTIGAGSNSTSPANLFNFRELQITVAYNNPIFTVTVDDPIVGNIPDFTRNYVVGDLTAALGGPLAYVGFTASTGDGFGNGGSNQYLSNFRFVPEPSTTAMIAIGACALFGAQRTRCKLLANSR